MPEIKKQNTSFEPATAECPNAHREHWFAVHTKPRQEHIAAQHLTNQAYEIYFPRVSVQKRKCHHIIDVIEPYFPRYLFVRFDEHNDDWGPIRSTRGVSSLVKFNGRPQPLQNELIFLLKSQRNSDGLQRVNLKTFSPGEVLDIEEGPFAGYRCLFEAERSYERVAVLLDIIGKQTRAVINKRDLALPQFA